MVSRVNLADVNLPPQAVSDRVLKHYAEISQTLPLALPDQCPEDVLNQILWHAVKGTQVPYPFWAVKLVDDD